MFVVPVRIIHGISKNFTKHSCRGGVAKILQPSIRRRVSVVTEPRRLCCQDVPSARVQADFLTPDQSTTDRQSVKRPRIRQHVNPLSQRLRELVEIPAAWPGGIYAETGAPLHIDVGSACGSFLLGLAQAQPEFNYVGLEIRRAMVDFANARAESIHAAGKVFFLCCNANAAMEKIFEQYTSGVVQRITINFPDPYFKRRQQKRRVVQPEFVRMLATKLATGAEIICQTDVSEVQGYVNEVFQSDGNFTREELSVSPFPVLTERELSSLRNGRQIYRSRFVRL